MVNDARKEKIRETLTNYLVGNNYRKTPERYAILDAVCDFKGHFTLDALEELLETRNFRVSKATLYNAMKLFIKLRLVVRHRFIGQTKYELCHDDDDHMHQVCTLCGKETEISAPEVKQAIEQTRYKRFRKDGFTLYIYGVCSSCQSRLTRKTNKKKSKNNNTQKE